MKPLMTKKMSIPKTLRPKRPGGAVLDECLAGVTPDDEDDGDGTQNLEAVNLTDGWGEG